MPAPPATDLFLALTPERVLEAVEGAGLPCRPLCYPLNSFENRVYEVELADRTRVVAKFYRPQRWSEAQILEEHALLAELIDDEIPVVAPLPFPGGGTLRSIAGILYTVFPRRGGRAPDDLDATLSARLGRLVARLHNVGARRPFAHRLRIGTATVRADLAWLAAHDRVPRSVAERYFPLATAICDEADRALAAVPTEAIRLHGDLHAGNLLLRDGLFHVVDLDDSLAGPAVQDAWLLFPGRDRDSLGLRAAFLDAYEEMRAFDRRTLALVEPLRGLRMVRHAGWIARRWNDPIFPRTWPEFGTDDHWLREVEGLTEQLAWIRGERRGEPDDPAGAPAADANDEPEPELTNRDFFWDWNG